MCAKTASLLSISRREFLASAAGIVATGLAAASPLSLIAKIGQKDADLVTPMPAPKRLHLDLPEARRVAHPLIGLGDECSGYCLGLKEYSSASLDALDHLTSFDVGFVMLGLEWIGEDMANVLVHWKNHFMVLDNLVELTPMVTRFLNTSNRGLIFPSLKHIDIEAASYLVDGGCHPLVIHISGTLSLPLAEILSTHHHELNLNVDSIEPRVAKALSRHQGHYLSITSKLPFPEDLLQIFSGNTMKHLTACYDGVFGHSMSWGNYPSIHQPL